MYYIGTERAFSVYFYNFINVSYNSNTVCSGQELKRRDYAFISYYAKA